LQALDVVGQLADDKVPGVPDLAKIRNPIADILVPMRRMAGWFLLGDEEES
jgi:hypothetical protein